MTDHPTTPPPELVQKWRKSGPADAAVNNAYEQHIATQAARWGADQELNECCHLLRLQGFDVVDDLRAARRPKPPSLKEQALETLRSMQIEPCWINGVNTNAELMSKYDILRRALEALDD